MHNSNKPPPHSKPPQQLAWELQASPQWREYLLPLLEEKLKPSLKNALYTQEEWARHNEAVGRQKAIEGVINQVINDATAHANSKANPVA